MHRTASIIVAATLSLSAFGADLEPHQTADLHDAIPSNSRVVLINFWATWCVPCVAELEDLVSLDHQFADRDFMILGVSLDAALPIELEEAASRARKMLEDKKIEYPNVLFTGSQRDLATEWDIDSGIPFSVLMSGSGDIISTYRGRIDPDSITKTIRQHLKKSPY